MRTTWTLEDQFRALAQAGEYEDFIAYLMCQCDDCVKEREEKAKK